VREVEVPMVFKGAGTFVFAARWWPGGNQLCPLIGVILSVDNKFVLARQDCAPEKTNTDTATVL